MKAIVYTKYGSPDVLELKEIEKPSPKENEVLVRIYAVSLNASDWELLRGKPFYARIMGILKPKYTILGSDIAGRIEAVGKNVSQFQPGDAVFGDIFDRLGGFAEFVVVDVNTLTLKPANLTYEQAAAIPQAACIALQGIRDKGQIQPGQEVLINGAGGSAGSFAIQIAKSLGAIVTGVDNTSKLNMMRSLGADHVIDYTKQDFTKNKRQYDLILDLVAHHSIIDYHRALNPSGRYLIVGGSMSSVFQTLIIGSLISLVTNKTMAFLALKINKDLDFILSLIEAGKIKPVIDKTYPLVKTADALNYLGQGHAKGKIVITLEPDD